MNRSEKMIVALTGCSHALSHGYQLIFPTVLLLLQKEFSAGYLELGVVGNVMSLAYGLGALPAGMIYNRLGPKKLFLFCFFGSSMFSFLVAASPSLILFTAGLTFLGALGSIYHPLANALITAKVRGYGKALGIHGAIGNIGLTMTPLIAGLIASSLGWRHVYLWFAMPGIILSLWALSVDMSSRPHLQEGDNPYLRQESLGKRLRIYFSLPLVILYIINILHHFCFQGAITFLPTYLAKRTSFHLFSLDSVAIGGMLSAIVLSMGVFGQYGGGVLSQKSRLERNFLLITIIVFPTIFIMSFTTDFLLLALTLLYFTFLFFLQPINNTLLARHTTAPMRGTAFGIYFFSAFAIGSLASSYSGFVAQTFGLQWVFLGLSGSALLLIFFALFLLKVKESIGPSHS